jgi:hypothetical protein
LSFFQRKGFSQRDEEEDGATTNDGNTMHYALLVALIFVVLLLLPLLLLKLFAFAYPSWLSFLVVLLGKVRVDYHDAEEQTPSCHRRWSSFLDFKVASLLLSDPGWLSSSPEKVGS